MTGQERVLGVASTGYPERRNFIDFAPPGWRSVRERDLLVVPRHLAYRATRIAGQSSRLFEFLRNVHFNPVSAADLLHLWNGVSLGRTPWITSFETAVPRWNYGSRPGLERLAGQRCRRLIAISRCAARIQERHLREHPELGARIRPKITVLHPPQVALVDEAQIEPTPDGPIRFLMVGRLFFLKGGLEVLRVFDRLLSKGYPLHLTVVSTLEIHDHATGATSVQRAEAVRIMGRHPGRIIHHDHLANAEVLDLIRRSDVALLPTFADTYGYFVLEAQACGRPVITTNVRALPEINDDEVGWVIGVPVDELGYARIGCAEHLEAVSRRIEEGLEEVVASICERPAEVRARGRAALHRVRRDHDPARFRATLAEIYDEALA